MDDGAELEIEVDVTVDENNTFNGIVVSAAEEMLTELKVVTAPDELNCAELAGTVGIDDN